MVELQIMEENLVKLISQHQSQPLLADSEPADPFQKVHFGKKMRKSHADSHCHPNENEFKPPELFNKDLADCYKKANDISKNPIILEEERRSLEK